MEKQTNQLIPLSKWYMTFMYMSIPIIGWIYLFVITKSKKEPLLKEFAKAFLYYKLTMLGACIIVLGIIWTIAVPYIDKLLAYMEML